MKRPIHAQAQQVFHDMSFLKKNALPNSWVLENGRALC